MALPRPAPVLERIYASSWSTPLALALVILSVLSLVVFPRLAARRIQSLREEMTALSTPARGAAGEVERALALEVGAARGYLLRGGTLFRARFDEAAAEEVRASAELERLAAQLGGDVPDRVARFRAQKSEWRDPIVALFEGRLSRGQYMALFDVQQARFEAIVAALGDVDDAIVAAEDRRRVAVVRAERVEDRLMVAAAVIALLSAVAAGALTRRLRVLTRRARRRAAEEQELRRLARALGVAATPHEVVQQVVEGVVASGRASGVWVEQARAGKVAVVAAAGSGAPAVGTRLAYPGSLTEAMLEGRDPEIMASGTRLVIPLFAEAELLGAVVLVRGDGHAPLENGDLAYARIVGDLTSASLRRVALAEEAQRERAALLASEEQFRALAETAQVAIFVIADDDTIVFANPPVERIFGYTVAELVGRPLVVLMPPEMRERHRAGVARYVATGDRRLSWEGVELPALSKDGREVPIEITMGEFIRDGRRYFTAIARDITERRRGEQERAALLAREREARTRVEAEIRTREEVLAIVSHDLRNPLNTIAMGASALKEFAADEPARDKYTGMIQRAIQRMNRLIEDLLDVVRLEGGQKLALNLSPVELAPLLGELCESFQAQADPRRQVLACDIDPALPAVSADRDRLAQVLTNLVGNALKFTPEGGRVEVSAALLGGEARVSVRDSGPGIASEDVAHIFDPYWQAGRTARLGAGLGLPIAKGIIDSHGGRLWVESPPGEGATFTFALPLAGAPDPAEEDVATTSPR